MDDDEDSFLYGDAVPAAPPVQKQPENVVEVIPVPAESVENQTNGVVAHLEAEAEATATADDDNEEIKVDQDNGDVAEEHDEEAGEEDGEEEEEAEEESDEDDIEFILEPPTRSLDFRSQRGGHRPTQPRTPSAAVASTPAQTTNLTTEYTPRERGAPPSEPLKPLSVQTGTPQLPPSTPAVNIPDTAVAQPTVPPTDDGPDPSTLPPVRAPPSHPQIDPNIPGNYEGRSIFEIDMTNLAEKPWRRPGSDLGDWFNYGFDEISWEQYCYRRRNMGEMANVLKQSVLGFAGMPEEQFLALPPEARTMVMTGTQALMSGGGPGPNGPPGVGVGPGMMPGVGMNPMGPMNPMMAAEMGGMGGMPPMGVGMGGPMGMGMNGDMGVPMQAPGQGPGPMMQDGGVPGGPVQVQGLGQGPGVGIPGPSGTPEQGGQMTLPDGMPGGPPGMMGMNMNMNPDFGAMQMQENNVQTPQMHPGIEPTGSGTPTPVSIPPRVGSTPVSFRGRGMAPNLPAAPRGARPTPPAFPSRGRGRGFDVGPHPVPGRPVSPLPKNVPTGPRNPGNKYKDRDNNAPAVEGLDYGGGVKEGGGSITPVSERDRGRERESEEKDKSLLTRSCSFIYLLIASV